MVIAFFTLIERKIMAAIQRRQGPVVVGFWGILQPFADGLKLFLKELVIPYHTNRIIFCIAPFWTFFISLLNWSFIPFDYYEAVINSDYGLLYIYAFSSLSVYGIILAGWASQSRYPFLGAIRAGAQMISYEVSIGTIFVIIAFSTGTLNLSEIVYVQENNMWLIIPLFPLSIIFFISILAETNRAPFDFPEAEAELVAGYNLEYSGFLFALFFLGEYSNIILMSAIFSLIFLGGWLPIFSFISLGSNIWFAIKIVGMCILFILVRATFPRYRYDQLMEIGWKLFFPYTFIYFFMIMVFFAYFQN